MSDHAVCHSEGLGLFLCCDFGHFQASPGASLRILVGAGAMHADQLELLGVNDLGLNLELLGASGLGLKLTLILLSLVRFLLCMHREVATIQW